jgi:hypothetical protein
LISHIITRRNNTVIAKQPMMPIIRFLSFIQYQSSQINVFGKVWNLIIV